MIYISSLNGVKSGNLIIKPSEKVKASAKDKFVYEFVKLVLMIKTYY